MTVHIEAAERLHQVSLLGHRMQGFGGLGSRGLGFMVSDGFNFWGLVSGIGILGNPCRSLQHYCYQCRIVNCLHRKVPPVHRLVKYVVAIWAVVVMALQK